MAKSASWWVTESYYPEYVEQFSGRAKSSLLRYDPNQKTPDSRFLKKCDEALEDFWRGQFDALTFARAIADANERQRIVDCEHFKFGDPSDWKEFQIYVAESNVLGQRESARKKLRECLPGILN